MNVLVIGSGGREHALCYKLLKSSKINKIYCIPGNAGTDEIATNIFADINDFDEIYKIVLKFLISFLWNQASKFRLSSVLIFTFSILTLRSSPK